MLAAITKKVVKRIKNPVFRANAQLYLDIEADFIQQIAQYGLPLVPAGAQMGGADSAASKAAAPNAPNTYAPNTNTPTNTATPASRLSAKGVVVANDGKSFCHGWVSPSCVTCRKGLGTATYSLSTQCPRDCFFCFNPNQENYLEQQQALANPSKDLAKLHAQGAAFHDLALTGGEPLLHKAETREFFATAQHLYPKAYTRLYTSGAFLDKEYLCELASIGLDEIRFSVKTDDAPAALEQTFERMRQARELLPCVVVEMPVMPDELGLMQELLLKLEAIGIDGINLLELCFPYHNAQAFKQRGYGIKLPPFRVLYNYSYAGGLPISGSEENCLALVEFAADKKLALGAHYCSLENKFSGQIYLQNAPYRGQYKFCSFSERDYFLKSAKVFGRDVEPVAQLLAGKGLADTRRDPDGQVLEFPLEYIVELAQDLPQLELGVSYHVVENDEAGLSLRELRLDFSTPEGFDPALDG